MALNFFRCVSLRRKGHAHRELSDPKHPQHEEWNRSRMIESDEMKELARLSARDSAMSAIKGGLA